MAIADRTSALSSGGLFLLTQRAKTSCTIQPETGAEVELRQGSGFLVARCHDCLSAEQAFDNAHEIAQKGLDILTAAGQRPTQITDAYTEVLLWWRQGHQQILRIVSVMPAGIEISMSLQVIKNGHIVPPSPRPTPNWHPSLRYFRLSQATDDLTEAFRNAYLAFESILSFRYPRGTSPFERERVWLTRALRAVDSTNPLSQAFIPRTADVVSEFIKDVYTDVRCRLFHAKSAAPTILPQSIADRGAVRSACSKLMRVTQMLIIAWLGGNRHGGSLSYHGFEVTYGAVLSNVLLMLEGEPMHHGISSVSIPMRIAVELNSPGLLTAIASVVKPRSLPILHRAQVTKAATTLLEYEFPGRLDPIGLDELQFQVGFQLRNSGGPKTIFRS
jgi:hypothetical protein